MSSTVKFGYVLDGIFAEHEAPRAHPECPGRILAVRDAFAQHGFAGRGTKLALREAREDELARAHTREYLAALERTVPGQEGWLDADTFYSAHSWPAVLAAAAASIDLTEAVLDSRFDRGAALVRPPGHHAEADQAMGFCLLNNAAIAAARAREGGARVSILDWDVHHGNGTQHIFESDPEVQYLSMHQYPFYPGTGAAREVGLGAGEGSTVNLALPSGCTDVDYAAAFGLVESEIQRFGPDIILLSAGFDAFEGDPLAGMKVTIGGFAQLSRRLVALSERVCQGRLVAILEGGYDLAGLGDSVSVLLEAMLQRESTSVESSAQDAEATRARPAVLSAIEATKTALAQVRGEAK